jgi:hypothetical protein
MQRNVSGRPSTQDLIRAYKARFGDRPVPEGDDDLREALGLDEIMDRLIRDERMASVPDNFVLYESAEERAERIRRTRAGLAELLRGDPEEHQASWEVLEAALVEARSPEGSTSTA